MSGAGADAAPRRLHPATMLIALVRGAPSTLLGVPALLALVARAELWLVLGGAALAVTAAGALRWLAWARFTYALTDDAVVIESGLLARNRRTVPFERVADVGITRRPLHRLFGVAAVTLETGGAGADEGALDSVSVAEAERLRDVVRRRSAAAAGGDARAAVAAEDAQAPAAAPVLFAMDTPRVLMWGLFNFSLVWIAVGAGALQYADRALDLDLRAVWSALAARADGVRPDAASAWAGAVALGALAVAAVGVAAGLVRTTLRDHGFRLTDEGGRLRRARGLFTRSESVVSLPRVQLAAIDDGPVRRLLGRARLRAQLLGGDGADGRQDLAPFADGGEIDRILHVLRLARADPSAMTPVARGHAWRALLKRVGPPALLIGAASLLTPFAPAALPLLAPSVVAALLARRHHRYLLRDGLLQVRRGVLGRTDWIVPASRIQAATVTQGPVQRWLGLATVRFDAAGGGGPAVHDLRAADAWALAAGVRATAR